MYDRYMRIWLIAENWPPRIGGIERYLTGIAGHLPAGQAGLEGHDITVIAPNLTQPLLRKERSTRSLPLPEGELEGVGVVRKKFFYPMWPKWLPLYWFLAKKARGEKPDLIICGKALFEGRLALKLKKKFGIPFIVCTYGMEIATWTRHTRTKKQLIRVLHDADAVLYINKKTKGELVALGVLEEKLTLVYPGIDPKTLDIKTSDGVFKKYMIEKPYILCVARLIKRKGIDDLLEAYSHIHNPIQLVIVGDGPERANLERHAKTLGVAPTFTGSIPDEDVHALYADATLFALTPKELPGDYEGFGIVYCEAAYFGLPVVGTRTGGVTEAVENGVTGILALPNHPKSITESLEKLLNNPLLAKQYGEAGKQRVLQKFQWTESVKPLKIVLSKL